MLEARRAAARVISAAAWGICNRTFATGTVAATRLRPEHNA